MWRTTPIIQITPAKAAPTNWKAISNSTFGDYYNKDIRAIAYGNNRFVAGGGSGKMAYSANGASWKAVSDNKFGSGQYDFIYAIAYGIADGASVGRFVAVGYDGKMAYADW